MKLRLARGLDRLGHTLHLPGGGYLCRWVRREHMKVCPDCIAREAVYADMERSIDEFARRLGVG